MAEKDLKVAHAIFKLEQPVRVRKQTQSPSAIVRYKIERSCPKPRKGLSYISTCIGTIYSHRHCCRQWRCSAMGRAEEGGAEGAGHGGRRPQPFPTRRRRRHRHGCLRHPCLRRSLRSGYCGYPRGGLWRYIGSKSRAPNRVNSFPCPSLPEFFV